MAWVEYLAGATEGLLPAQRNAGGRFRLGKVPADEAVAELAWAGEAQGLVQQQERRALLGGAAPRFLHQGLVLAQFVGGQADARRPRRQWRVGEIAPGAGRGDAQAGFPRARGPPCRSMGVADDDDVAVGLERR
ncbi:hypothetical protein FQZ97_1028000 [compost metagenome]